MPSAGQSHTFTRRQLLAACGSCVGISALSGYAYGSGFWRDDDCNPTPLDTSPADWPLPDYDGGNTRALPAEHAPQNGLSVKWSIDVQHPGQPIATNGSIFVSGIRSPDFITAYDLSTGQERWTNPITAGRRPSVVAGGDSLFIGEDTENGDTVSRALATADRSEQWTSDVASGQVTPVLDSGLLIFRESSNLIAIDARTGAECWQEQLADRPRSSTIHAGDTIVLETGTDGEITALDTESGDQQWTAPISDYFHPDTENINDAVRGRLVAGTDSVFFRTFGGVLIALDAATGETDWATPETPPEIPSEDGRHYLPPGLEPAAFTDDVLVAIESDATDRSDSLHAIDPVTGSEQWAFEPEEEEDVRIRSVAVGGETLFAPIMGELNLIDLVSGNVLETHDFDGYAQSVTLADGLCLVGTTEEIVAFEEASG